MVGNLCWEHCDPPQVKELVPENAHNVASTVGTRPINQKCMKMCIFHKATIVV